MPPAQLEALKELAKTRKSADPYAWYRPLTYADLVREAVSAFLAKEAKPSKRKGAK